MQNDQVSSETRHTRRTIGTRVAEFVATFAYVGRSPIAPGTCGALAALPIGWWLSTVAFPIRVVVITVLGFIAIEASRIYVATKPRVLDPQEIVVDEVVGTLIALAPLPWTFGWVVAAFLAFRLFDIAKPGPVGWIDRKMKTPAGIVLDDVAAGLIAAALLFGIGTWMDWL